MKKWSVIMFSSFISACFPAHYKGPQGDHFDGKIFFSPYGEEQRSLKDVLKWRFSGEKKETWPEQVDQEIVANPPAIAMSDHPVLTFVNHATMLIQVKGLNILTDPVFSDRTSPFNFVGPKRVRKPGIEIEKLPKIDLVLISHNHYDHLDLSSLQKLHELFNPLILVPLGDARVVDGIKGLNFKELDWRQSVEIGANKITFLPSQHWSARTPFDRNFSLWGSYMIQTPVKNIYFAGDTGYGKVFKEIAALFPKIDLALIPIGAYKPIWFMNPAHVNPAEAVQVHKDLNAKTSIAIHFGTWQLSDEGIDEPVQDLETAKQEIGLAVDAFQVLKHGETKVF